VGTYDPLPQKLDGVKEVRLKVDRVKYWLAVGAQPSSRVAYLLWRAGMVPTPPIRYTPTKWVAKEKEKKGFHTLAGAVAATATPAAQATTAAGFSAGSRGAALGSFCGLFTRLPAAAAAVRMGGPALGGARGVELR
jgi:ribosomal protein S16